MNTCGLTGRALNRHHGLTVLEMLNVLAALTIVIVVTVPTSSMFLEKHRLKSASSQLSTSLEMARSEAQIRGSTVRVCPSSNGQTCRTDGNWNLGWLVFSDGNGDGAAQDIEMIRAYNAPHQQVRIQAEGAVMTRASFTVAGLIEEHGAPTGRFRVCHLESNNPPTVVTVDTEGWIRRAPTRDQSCHRS